MGAGTTCSCEGSRRTNATGLLRHDISPHLGRRLAVPVSERSLGGASRDFRRVRPLRALELRPDPEMAHWRGSVPGAS